MGRHNWVSSILILVGMDLVVLNGSWTQDQISWTPIYVDTTNRLDLWTISSTGCECPRGGSNDCACCVKPGGCLCSFNPNKCSQCGLEDACQRFCNVSISSRVVATRSGLSWVQIKSPELEGPTTCWWKLYSAPGQRIEVQIHRLVAMGHYDNKTLRCSGGFLQFADGDVHVPSNQAIQLCAQNSRYSPPVVLFGDQGTATLLIRTELKTTRSTLLAYVSFSSADDMIVGDPSKGGRLRPHSACDWIYDNCFGNECILASPGYPGLFPPHRRCRYILNANATTDKIRIRFSWLSLPPQPLCSTHHVAIWRRNVSNFVNLGNPWKTLCEESETSLEIDGGAGLIEFRSGSTISPYLYTGFRATVQFIHSGYLVPPTESSYRKKYRPQLTPSRRTLPPPIYRNYDEDDHEDTDEPMGNPRSPYGILYEDASGVYQVNCGHTFEGSLTRGSIFRLIIPKDLILSSPRLKGFGQFIQPMLPKQPPPGPFKCQLKFRGKPSDVVQLAVFNYRFRGSSCSSYMEVYDMEDEEVTNQTDRLLGKLCGPSGNEVKRFTSSHSRMALVTLVLPYEDPVGTEFLEGAFRFHDESIEGTVKPMSSCEVVYYGVTSPPTGSIIGPPDSPLLRLSTFPLVCAYSFLPGGNQTISLTLTRGGHETSSVAVPGSKVYCRSFCGPSGCQCESKYTRMEEIDHLLIVAGTTPVSCLCGYFPDALPMTFESHAPLTLVYHATQGGREFNYGASFQFKRKIVCSNFSIKPPSDWDLIRLRLNGFGILNVSEGSKRWREALGPGVASFMMTAKDFQQYTHFHCVWPVVIPQRYNLTIDFVSEENEKDCNAWNLTVWAGDEHSIGDDFRNLIGSFCPRYGRHEVKVPENVVYAYIRLIGVSLRAPQFEIRWKYTDVMLPGLTENKGSCGNPTWSMDFNTMTLIPHAISILVLSVVAVFIVS